MIYIFVFLLGLIIGSFLNAVIYRLEINQSAFRGRSFCPKCRHILAWQDLAPLFSFIWLRGRCRYCGKRISIQYPLVELATGLLFLSIFNFFAQGGLALGWQFSIFQFFNLFYWFYIISVLIIIFVYDLKHYIIPDKIVLPAILVSLVWILGVGNYLPVYGGSVAGGEILGGFVNPLLIAVGVATFFFLLIVLSKGRWMGFGDVKLVFLMGLILGYPQILIALFTAFFIGAIIGIGLIVFGKKTLRSQVPFGPFLVGGAALALFFGEIIINWYWSVLFL